MTVREAVEWCGDQIGVREATRLRRLTDDDKDDNATATAESGGAGARTAVR